MLPYEMHMHRPLARARPVSGAAQAVRARGLPPHAFMNAGNIPFGGRAAFVTGEQAVKDALADGYQAGLRVVAPDAQRQTGPVVSVVIPSCDRPALLLRCLDALLTQERVGGEIEIIVVDDARSTEQEALLTSFLHTAGAGQLVRYLRQPNGAHGPAAARNTGWRAALPGSSVRQHRNLLFEALLYKKHPRLYREKISPAPPFHHYATVIAALVTVVGVVTGAPTPATAGAVGWALLTVRLAARRLRGTSRSVSNVADIVFSSVIIPFVAVYWRLAGALRFRVLFA